MLGNMIAWEDAYMRVEINSELGLVRHTRSARMYADVPSLITSLRATLDQTQHLDRSQYVLLQDMRAARGRNDPEFEQAITRERAGMSAEFRRLALIVSTNVGRMHVQRHMQQMGLPARVFLDEQQALQWLAER